MIKVSNLSFRWHSSEHSAATCMSTSKLQHCKRC